MIPKVALARRWGAPAFATADRMALGFAAIVIVLAAASAGDPTDGAAGRGLGAGAILLLVAAAVLLFGSRRYPGTVALAMLGLSFTWYGVGYTSGLINVGTLAAFYGLGVSEGERRKVAVAAAALATMLVGMVVVGDESLRSALTAGGYILMALLFGESIRTRRLLVDHMAARAERAEAEAERRVVEERLRIARDIHDVLAHTVSAMTVQAEVAADALDRDQQAVSGAVHAIRQAGRDVMDEVRATVAVLRYGDDAVGPPPTPCLAAVADLLGSVRQQGLEVVLDQDLSGRPLPEMVELTAFRVVQEGITNVVRHARARSAHVTIREAEAELVVEVRDDGPGANERGEGGDASGAASAGTPASVGFGLRGMAERVESIGGQLWHGRDPADHGWIVRARLPLPVPVR